MSACARLALASLDLGPRCGLVQTNMSIFQLDAWILLVDPCIFRSTREHIPLIMQAGAFFPDGASLQSGAAIMMRLLETGQHATILFGDTSIKGIK